MYGIGRCAIDRCSIGKCAIGKYAIRGKSFASRPPLTIPYNTGQPTFETRPHYISRGDLTPGISALEYYQRRLNLAKKLPDNSIAILIGNQTQFSSGAVFYDFQQNNDLFYLTGWLEPNSVVILEKKSNAGNDDGILLHMLVPGKNPKVELWEGEKLGLEGAYDFFNADLVEDVSKVERYVKGLLEKNDNVFVDLPGIPGSFKSFFGGNEPTGLAAMILRSRKSPKPLTPLIAELRSLKSKGEISVMQKAGQISSQAINRAMAKVGSGSPLRTEKSLGKYLEYEFVIGGCDKQAYIPVVASGKNALTIHYTRNDDILFEDELVFVDAGGKLGGYCADISRAWPNSPKGFSEPQRDLYEVVLNTNKKCIEMCSEDKQLSINDIHEFSINSLAQGLRSLPGFSGVSNNVVGLLLYPHYIGHHLGLDLHDIPSVSKHQKLVKGNVITIEPGLYIPQTHNFPKHFQGIGIRVEDDVAVGWTSSDIINLTRECVKEVGDVVRLVGGTVKADEVEEMTEPL